MECPQCRHVSQEKSPRFCSQCGQKLSPAAPVQGSETNAILVAPASEGKTEGEELKEGSPGSSKGPEIPEESASEASWSIQTSKKEKKRRRRKRSQSTSLSSEAHSSPSGSGPWSLDVLSSPGSQDSALPQSQAQGAVGGQSGQSLRSVNMPMEEDGSVPAEGSSIPPQGDTVKGTDSDTGRTQREPVPSNHTDVKDCNISKPSVDGSLRPEGDCGPTLSAYGNPPEVSDASQRAPLPESEMGKSEHKEEMPVTAELAASEPGEAPARAASPVKKAQKEARDRAQQPSPVSPAAAQRQHQEAEHKGKSAETGRKTGEGGNSRPGDQKKPEENRSYAAALKDKKEQRTQKAPEEQRYQKAAVLEATVRTLNPGDGVTVYFHAIVSRNFALKPDSHTVWVRGGEGLGKTGWTDACEMHCTKDLQNLGVLIEGSMVIPRESLDKHIPYKYVIHRHASSKDTPEYEFIYEKPQKGKPVNRCLLVESALVGTGDWHQYDDIICMKPPGKVQKVFDIFTDGTRKDLVKGKKDAAAVMLDRIFSILQPWNDINLHSFMVQFKQFYSVVRVPMIHEVQARPWSSLQYDESEVRKNLWEHVRKQMESFLQEKREDSLPADCPVRSRLQLGLAILFMVETVDFVDSKHDLIWLCDLLIPGSGSLEALHSDLSPILRNPQIWRAYLIKLCHRGIAEEVDSWLGILPVLHRCMQLPPPRKDTRSQSEDAWAGLEGICFAEFRDKASTKNQVLQFMQPRMALLQVDEYLFRSWFSLVPLENLTSYLENSTDYFSHMPARILDCFQGISYRLRGLKISSLNTEVAERVFKMLIYLVDIYKDRILGETLLQTYLTECLTIHETVCKITAERKFYEIPALSAKLVCKMLQLQPAGRPTEGPDAKDNEDWMTHILRGVLNSTRTWLQNMFKGSRFCTSSAKFTYPEEMALWQRLVDIAFPERYGWKRSLLEDMEGRIKQVKAHLQIAAFCSNKWNDGGLHDSVSRSFEKCVVEAVSSAYQTQTSVLERLSCQDLQKFGTLLSAVITKSWPVANGQTVFDMDEIFKYLLTWPDVKELFKLCGTNEKMLEHITGEARQLMATAVSVFQKVAEELENGTIVVGQLELIFEHREQFTEIWNQHRVWLPLQKKACDLTTLLAKRCRDLCFLKQEKRYVDSLLRQFGRVKHLVQVEFGNVEAVHSQDLSKKKLSEVLIKLPGSSPPKIKTHYNLSREIREIASKLDSLKDSHIFQDFWQEAAESLSPNQDGTVFSLSEACDCLYYPCYEKFYRLYENLKSGEITFAEVDDIFRDFADKYDELTADLKFMCTLDPQDHKGWISERVGQIKEYHSLHQAVSSAKVILQVRSTLGVTGNFSVLDTLLNFADSFENFRHKKLKQISPQFIEAKKLLECISEPRHRCLEELSRHPELVGWLRESLKDINELKVFVDLASISAGENDIDVDRVACFHDAVQGYAPLLYKMDSRAGFDDFMVRLQELWRALDNDEHLPSKLQDSARNLEWLKTVKESHGSVELSSLSLATAINNSGVYVIKAPEEDQKISPDTVLHLSLPEDHGAQEITRMYTTEGLKELLNKLMLMSGKKDHSSNGEVEKFSEIFSSMQRLVHAFINLHCAGNMLFRTWTAEVHCSPRQGISIKMNFGLELVSQLTESGDVIELLGALCRLMEDFLEDWKAVVVQKRTKHFYLNFYTAEQLVYLSSELGKPRPSEDALMMLSFIKGNCTVHDIAEATSSYESSASRHSLREEVVTKLRQQLHSESHLLSKLQAITEQSLRCMSAFLPDCLDLDALGSCLAQLATLGDSPVERPLPMGLQVGQPNLVLCGHSEVLPAALAIYMRAPGQPLPSFDEVLLCTPGTTIEEVELLLRRCLTPGSREHKVYSLLFADRLSYEVGCQAEERFQSLCTQRHRENYQLVIICDAAREHCYLPSAFSQHKVPLVPQAPLQDIRAYLGHHYQVPKETLSAAAVFRDRMCVGIVTSARAGVGKSLYVNRLHTNLKMKLRDENVPLKIIRLTDPQVDENRVLGSLLPFLKRIYQKRPMIVHIDVSTSVQTGIPVFLFKLLILQYLMDINGKMWLRNPRHLYVIEITQGSSEQPKRSSKLNARAPVFTFLDIFPKVTCHPPKDVINMELRPRGSHREPGMDPEEFSSEAFQRPYQYLKRFHQNQNLDSFLYKEGSVEGSPEECLQHFLIYCGVVNPSWAELRNFAWFLNCQLKDCENSVFCKSTFTGDTLRGFKNFVVTFMILMARDFATPSLHTLDESPGKHLDTMDGVAEEDLAPFSLRKRWESEPHPYVFFNGDRVTMTFIGFHLQPNHNGYVDAINPWNRRVIKKDVMTKALFDGLKLQRVPFNINFDCLPRHEKLEKLCLALGIEWPIDPDETYELTTDNMLKILAIEMRFRCGIPVIIMGETGCGKTRLIKFLSDLKRGSVEAQTLELVKVHGGTTPAMIYSKVKDAERTALANQVEHELDTILFFDEANTTEAISCIKEVLCDRTVDGESLIQDSGLQIIAACNPYRKHSREMILRLESAGLGYRVSAEETEERLGSIPLRQLVYRVHALPPSLIPLVWDFGQLNDSAEELYIRQIVQRLVDSITVEERKASVIADVLSASQRFMRKRENECGFVSLRDVERCVKVFRWFHDHSEMLLRKLDDFLQESRDGKHAFERDPALWSLVMATGVCYHASLEDKASYRTAIGKCFPEPYDDSQAILDEITHAQDLFLRGAPIRPNIARNLALKENVFMMVICIELRIPLFLVGKPGSSKSLAKTIVADAMQGPSSFSELFRCLKQVHLVSFQCSPHSTPQGIIGTFKQCARFQQGKDLQQYVSVVVLDEVGLAEDSPKMPLKTLHPLLEDGCIEDDPAPYKKVGFVGISNWALDPAKMNRGIFVSRDSPSEKELIESAEGICSSDRLVQDRIRGYFAPFAKAYETVCRMQDKEFFGLRDYYSLIKMVFAKAKASNQRLSPQDIAHAVLRNFSGKDNIQALDIFTASLPGARYREEVSAVDLIKQNISGGLQTSGRGLDGAEARYLLVLTRNYVALQILQQRFFGEGQQPEIIFGSSFPRDQEYTQVCRNINRVKICMETGKMVVLLNLQNLYESLYDALNQYYVYLGGQKYVDLGLGTHRVKCRVHSDFRLIVIEEKDVVYRQFPVPLINRLEKHYLDTNTMLEGWQKGLVRELEQWACDFADVKADQFLSRHKYGPADAFIGYHSDACASAVLQAVERLGPRALTEALYRRVAEEAKFILLDCATPDAVVRLSGSSLGAFAAEKLSQEYYCHQQHTSLADFLRAHVRMDPPQRQAVFTEITTFSRLLTSTDCEVLESELKGLASKPMVLSLEQFDTEYSFLKDIRSCLTIPGRRKILVIQTDFDSGVRSAQLVASAKYSAINEINKAQGKHGLVFVYFITKLSRVGSGASYVGFNGGLWRSVHIDDLRRSTVMASDVTKLQKVTISQLFNPVDKAEPDDPEEEMETETSMSGEMAEENMEVESPEQMETASDPGGSEVLDTTRLLRSCVQTAVGMLRDQNESCARNMRRVVILLDLLNEDTTRSASFLRESKRRLHVLLKKQEENQVQSLKEWVTREAADQDALQEAGTFRHTLWKRVQGVVTPLLASMISHMDRDGNLELLARPDSPAWAQDLWMFIYSDIKFLDIPLVNNTWSQNEMPSILVQSDMNLLEDSCNAVPFSGRIRDYLEELWVQAQYITDTEGLLRKFLDIFQKTPLGSFLAERPEAQQQDLLQSYSKDFLLLTIKVASQEELRFLQMALWSCVSELRVTVGMPEKGLSLPWVHLAYQHFRTRLQNFSRIVTIQPEVLKSLSRAQEAQECSFSGCEMTLDAFAAMACVEALRTDILKPSPKAWLQTVKNLSTPLELLCSSGYSQDCGSITSAIVQEVRVLWNRIFSVALFVEHVLLETERQIPELSQLVTTYVSRLDKCLERNSDLKTHRPFVAVMTILRDCKEEASRTFSRFGIQSCHICLGDAQDPVCLPCDHVYCLACIRTWLVPGQMKCPYCLTDLSDNFSPTVSQEQRQAIGKHAQFRHMCNGFFVDLVSTMCFKDDSPPQGSVIDSLLSLLFIQKESVRDASQKHCEHTKTLSPFSDIVDKTPVIRSVILKLLLKYSFHEVKVYIQKYLTQLEDKAFPTEDKTELYLLFISCLEDSVHEKTSAGRGGTKQSLREEGHFLTTYSSRREGQEPASTASVDYLQEVARVRLCLDLAADVLSELQEGSGLAEDKRCFLRHVEQFCTRVKNDWHRVYLVRKLSSLRGMEFVQRFSRQGHPHQWIFPRDVIAQQKDNPSQMDRYLVHGDEYKALRDAVGKVVLECRTQGLETALKACRRPKAQQTAYLLLALHREMASLYRSRNASLHPKAEQCKAMNEFIKKTKILSAPKIGCFAKSLVDGSLPLLRSNSPNSSPEDTVIDMAVHAAAMFLCAQNKVLEPLRNLAFSPATMANAYLPTMPEDLLVKARSWITTETLHWWYCPNGHPCSVGECGMPTEESVCPDCHAKIGGLNHNPHRGFQPIGDIEDRTQTGHVLGNPPSSGAAIASDRGLSPVVFILTQLLTHLAMLVGATQNPQALISIIKPRVQNPQGFLQLHIQRNLEQLTRMLGKSADEATHVVHLILGSLLRERHPTSGQRVLNFESELSTKECRNNWEKHFESLLLPEFEHLDKSLPVVNALISQDERISSNPVAKIIYGDPATFLCHLPPKSVIHCSRIWSCRKKITVEYLQHIVEQKNGQETLPVLWLFLQKEAELRLVKFLPEILALQRDLVNQFQNVSEVEYSSIRGFLSSHQSDGLRKRLQDRITVFLSTWNALRRSLETNGEIKLPKEYCCSDLDLEAQFEIILPRRRGLGLCATALVSYLISLHNQMVYAVQKFSEEDNSYSVDISEVADLHVISYEVERDLTPLLLTNCQYQVQQGGETSQEFDLEKIQRQICSRLLQGKPRLTLKKIPTLVCRRDWNYEQLFMNIKNKMAQNPLPKSAISAISGQLQSYSDACEALSIIEVTLGFLSTAGGDPGMDLNVYVQDALQMGDQTALISKALSSCQLRHVIALWQFLSAHKSEQRLRLKKELFREIDGKYKKDLSPQDARLLHTFLNEAGLDTFLLELHEMIVLKLRGPQAESSFNPNWSLKDTLVSYMETKDSDVLPEVESQFPEEILMSSCISVWKAAATRKQDRQARVAEEAKFILLDCATPDAVVRLSGSSLGAFAAEKLSQEYYCHQQHTSLADFLRAHVRMDPPQRQAVFTEITTFSRLLTSTDCEVLESELKGLASKPMVLSLEQFDTEYSFLKDIRSCLTIPGRRKILVIQTDFDSGVRSAQLVASAKYSAINEINKAQGKHDLVFVYFITKLSRVGSGASYVGFNGGLWRSVHIDDLRRSTIMASDVTKLQKVTISQLFNPVDKAEPDDPEEEMETETSMSGEMAEENMEVESPEQMETASDPGGSEVLDTTRLLRSCVQTAVGMLRDQNESCARNMRRVVILLDLLNEDTTRSASFLRESKRRLHVLLTKQEENQVQSLKEWVTREAADQDALQEAGTFRHTLWKRVQGVVTPLLASMISHMDRDGNLELLARPDSPAWAQDLWMFIYSDIKFLDIPLVNNTWSQNEMPSILVQSDMNLLEDSCNAVPFSGRIRDYLEELWVQAQYITDTEGLLRKFVDIFQKTPLGSFLAERPEAQQQDLLQSYSKDFLLLTIKVASQEELRFLQMALWSCVSELRVTLGMPEKGLSLPWVHLAYQHFRTRLQNFSRIVTIQPEVLKSLSRAQEAQECSFSGCEMTLDAFAAMACVEALRTDILKPSPKAWLQTVKNLSTPLELLCSSGYLQDCGSITNAIVQEVRVLWNRIFSVALFVEHVLLETERQIPELSQLVTTYVSRLDKCLERNSDLKTQRPFVAVMTILRDCKEEASRTFSRFDIQSCHICLGDAQDPVCLPCDHVYCLACIRKWLVPGQRKCPYCLTDLSDNFSPTVSQEQRQAIGKHAQFRHMCNCFFVDLVSTMCFKDDSPPQGSVIDSLLSLLFIQKESVRDASQKHCEHTKTLSPFSDVVDKTPVIRSVILKLLLKYSFHEVKDYIQKYLTQLEDKAFPTEDKTELYLLFISCLEDSVHEKTSAGRGGTKQSLREEGHFLTTYSSRREGQEPASTASVDYLQEVARVRLCLDLAADVLSELQEGSGLAEDKRCFLRHVEQFCTRVKNDWHRVYLVRKLSSLCGMEFVQRFSRQGHPHQWIFPRDVIAQQKDNPSQMDRYLVHGDEYKALRDAVGKAVLECRTQGLETALKACRRPKAQQTAYLLLALHREMASLYRSRNASLHPKAEQCKAMNEFIKKTKILSAPKIGCFAKSLVDGSLPLLRSNSPNSSPEDTVIDMAVHAAAMFLCAQNKVLEPLRNLAFSPATMANAYLPTMPEDLLVKARSWTGQEGLTWYNCPNGHPCSVGECGKPMEESVCPDCHAKIGGLNHNLHRGFQPIRDIEDRTQTGHVLGNPPSSGAAMASDRGLSPVVFILTQLLTHLAMLVGATQNPQALISIIKPRVQNPQGFLQLHIQRNLEQLTRMLGKSADEATHVVHLILGSLLRERHPTSGQRVLNFESELSTKECRNNWEKHFESLLLPELEHLDKSLPVVNALISQDERISSNPVAKIIYGDPATFLCHLPPKSVIHCSRIWSCRKKITVEYLQHIVEQKNGQETLPVLWLFLQKEAELRLVKFLPEILALQRDLVNQFQNVSEVEYSSIRGFLSSHQSDGLRKRLQDRITVFLSTWNALRRSLETNGEIKLPKEYCRSDLDLEAEFEIILPRRRGPGLCATALVSYLISLHNQMVYAVQKFSEEDNSYSVDISEVADLHVISYEVERDLTPLLLSNCQYQVQQGGETSQEFDLEKIQRQICSRFLQGKPRLTLKKIPTLVCRRDWNYEQLFMNIKNKMAQNPLPKSAISAISGQLQSYSDACEALSIIEVTLGFLSTAGGDPGMDLNVYVQDALQMGDQTALISKALSSCQLRHVIALWQFLSAHKSEQRLRLKKELFREIDGKYKKDLSPQDARLLHTFLNEAGLDTFLLELHEMIVLKLRGPQAESSFNPNWSLKDTLVSYMETKDSDVLPEVESQFPEEILMSSCISVWKAAATRKQDRQAR